MKGTQKDPDTIINGGTYPPMGLISSSKWVRVKLRSTYATSLTIGIIAAFISHWVLLILIPYGLLIWADQNISEINVQNLNRVQDKINSLL